MIAIVFLYDNIKYHKKEYEKMKPVLIYGAGWAQPYCDRARICMQCIINSGAIIEHDCTIGDFSHISPPTTLCGGVTVGALCHIGDGTSVKNGITIHDQIVVGCANAVVSDLCKTGTYVGVPAKKIIL